LTEEIKKYILNLCESDLPTELVELCTNIKLDIIKDTSEVSVENIVYAIVDSENTTVPSETPKLFIGKCNKQESFFKNNGKGIIGLNVFKSKLGEILLKRLFGDSSSLNFEKAFDNGVSEARSLKLEHMFKVGSTSDVLSKDAFEADFNFLSIRNFFNSLASFYGVLSQSETVEFPVEIDYGQSDECFVVQTHVSIDNFDSNLLLNSFGEFNSLSPFNSLLTICSKQADIIDCYILKSSSRLVITGVWYKEHFHQIDGFNASIFLNNIESFKRMEASDIEANVDIKQVDYNLEDNQLSKEKLTSFDEEEKKSSDVKEHVLGQNENAGSIVVIKRIVEFIKKYRGIEPDARPIEELDISDLKEYLDRYPNKPVIKKLSEDDHAFILKALKDASILESINSNLEIISESVDLEEFGDSFISKLNSLSMGEASDIVSAASDNREECITRVGGWVENFSEDHTVVKGSGVETDDEVTIVKGHKEDLTQKAWTTKKSEIVEDVKECITRIKGDGKDLKALENEVVAIISTKLNIPEEDCLHLTKGLLDNATEPFIVKSMQKMPVRHDEEASSQHVRDRLENEKLKGDLELRESQLIRLKRIITGMREQISASKLVVTPKEPKNTEESLENTKLQAELAKLTSDLEKQKKAYEVLQNSNSSLNENAEEKINSLQQEIEKLNIEKDNSKPVEDENIKIELEKENKKLAGKVKISNRRIENLSARILELSSTENNIKAEEHEKSEKMSLMEEQLNTAQDALSNYKSEKEELETRIEHMEKANAELLNRSAENQIEPVGVDDQLIKEKDLTITKLTLSMKNSEDKLKSTILTTKQLEQKNKFLIAQLEEAQKQLKKKGKSGGTINSGGDPALTNKLKKLKLLNEKVVASNEKNANDLVEKKKEVIKFKTEVTKLQNKIDELERKFGKAA
jgi:hypothetical protein